MNMFYRNRQLLFLTLTLIVVWGVSAFLTLPRLEDPEIVQRNASITTLFPGASAERVESLVTEKIEEEFSDVEEISNIESTSSPNISVVQIELKDTVADVTPVWARIRSQLEDVSPELPPGAQDPVYEDADVAANALIVGLSWDLETPVNAALLQRVAEGLEDQLEAIPGTDKVELFGVADEEIQVVVDQTVAARLGLTAEAIAQQVRASDAKVSAGTLQGNADELLLEIDSNLESLERIRQIPIRVGEAGQTRLLGDVTTVSKAVQEPAEELALISSKPAVVLSVQVESSFRVDNWAQAARQVLASFEETLSDGLSLTTVLDQSQYVQQRLNGVIGNLLLSSGLVIVVSLFMLGWRSAAIVGLALPLATLMVFGAMKVLNIPLHQMSVTGLIIALGLLIDNAIVVVDEVQIRLRAGLHPSAAVSETVKHLVVPLIASTLTTVLAFVPIATSPGGTGEFIGTIGATVILALLSSLALSLTVIAAMIGLIYRRWPTRTGTPAAPLPAAAQASHWWEGGFSNRTLSTAYANSLYLTFRRPILGIGLALILPIFGFVQFAGLPQQFFPPTNRDQFQIEFEMPAQTAMALTRSQVLQARDLIREHPAVEDVHWFLGKSAPSFFYNVVASRENAPDYAQALVQLNNTDNLRETITTLQQQLDAEFPQAQALVRQLEQGPPFPAPIELRLYGSEMSRLRELGNQLRGELAQIPNVIHTRADLSEVQPKLALQVSEVAARRTGLDNGAIAAQLNSMLDGAVGGSLLEDTEDIPVRVRVGDAVRGDLSAIASTDLLASSGENPVPLSAVASIGLVPDIATIARYNGQRVNNVQAFLTAGALPDTVLTQFQQQLEESGFELPKGYRIEYGGEADARGTAVGNLLASVGVLAILMVATLVLSFNSFAIAALLGIVAVCAVGLAAMALWLFNSIFGFTAILGTLGLIGLAINDSIVVLAALREDSLARTGDVKATVQVVLQSTRHVAATTVTTIVGFVPLMLDSTGFWPPLAIAIAGGLGGATLLALYFIPAAYILIFKRLDSQPKNLQLDSQLKSAS
ncbi:efflux RND transporter permease subunit [cf. Phormidesmis sp. LEGE 11477]|uniref:efflux RND transporter permease subunit n=1 Tax=cf. Phormidesmis sp. LEGE 11477 TaxID=1828680 RepID=UPI001882AFAB|nr:efflux RND transporter permease subunit [cf. Phormidesmis sp. LEGE 11477]MBE9060773.1 efflux RND transporter permease subunit [cf. Phormidesmis sp. LEGE 11477]